MKDCTIIIVDGFTTAKPKSHIEYFVSPCQKLSFEPLTVNEALLQTMRASGRKVVREEFFKKLKNCFASYLQTSLFSGIKVRFHAEV